MDDVAAYYRERSMAAVVFTVDWESRSGIPPIPNEEIAEAAAANADVLIPFASVDPGRPDAVARARRLIEEHGVKGFKFHPNLQEFFPNERSAYPLYEAIAEAGLPALFHTGHSGIGTGLPGGGGLRLKYSNPMCLDDVAADFPELPIVLAHPSFPWQDEAISICLHKANVWIDLSGWSPKYFPPQLVQYANTQLRDEGALRLRLPADHARPLAGRLRAGAVQGRGAAADPEGERGEAARSRARRVARIRSRSDAGDPRDRELRPADTDRRSGPTTSAACCARARCSRRATTSRSRPDRRRASCGAVEDDAIREAVRAAGGRRAAGRRPTASSAAASWHMDFIYQLDGVADGGRQSTVEFHNAQGDIEFDGRRTARRRAGRPLGRRSSATRSASSGRRVTTATPKLTIPSPSMVHYRGGRAAIDENVYPDLDEFWADLVAAYREEVRRLGALGCTYLQFDDTSLAYLNDPEQRALRRVDRRRPRAPAPEYIRHINEALAGRPGGHGVTTHMCRGNFRSSWVAEGGYDFVAEALFNELDVDGFFMEWDDERSGGFEPLRFLPKGPSRSCSGS